MLTAAVLVALAVMVWPTRAGDASRSDAVRPGNVRAGGWARWRVSVSRRLRRRPRHPWVADLAEVTAVGLDAGLDLVSAALLAARSPSLVAAAPWLVDHLEASVEAGRGVASLGGAGGVEGAGVTLTDQEQSDLAMLEMAWRLGEQAGAATSVVTAAAASSIRARHAAGERAAVVAAGPRASMWLLSALPVVGPFAAVIVGIGPGTLYGTDAARVSAVAGLLLAAGGWWWSRALIRRAERPGRTDGSVA